MPTTRQLEIVRFANGKRYYRDERLQEFRNVKNPHDRITFEEMADLEDKLGEDTPEDFRQL
jgi:hypothetical protein